MDYQKKRFLNTTAQFHPNETLISKKNSKSNEKTKKLAIPKYIQDQNAHETIYKLQQQTTERKKYIKKIYNIFQISEEKRTSLEETYMSRFSYFFNGANNRFDQINKFFEQNTKNLEERIDELNGKLNNLPLKQIKTKKGKKLIKSIDEKKEKVEIMNRLNDPFLKEEHSTNINLNTFETTLVLESLDFIGKNFSQKNDDCSNLFKKISEMTKIYSVESLKMKDCSIYESLKERISTINKKIEKFSEKTTLKSNKLLSILGKIKNLKNKLSLEKKSTVFNKENEENCTKMKITIADFEEISSFQKKVIKFYEEKNKIVMNKIFVSNPNEIFHKENNFQTYFEKLFSISEQKDQNPFYQKEFQKLKSQVDKEVKNVVLFFSKISETMKKVNFYEKNFLVEKAKMESTIIDKINFPVKNENNIKQNTIQPIILRMKEMIKSYRENFNIFLGKKSKSLEEKNYLGRIKVKPKSNQLNQLLNENVETSIYLTKFIEIKNIFDLLKKKVQTRKNHFKKIIQTNFTLKEESEKAKQEIISINLNFEKSIVEKENQLQKQITLLQTAQGLNKKMANEQIVLKEKLQKLNIDSIENSHLRSSLIEYQEKIQILQNELSFMSTKTQSENINFNEEMAKIKNKNDSLKKNFDQITFEKNKLEKDYILIQSQMKLMKEEINQLKNQLDNEIIKNSELKNKTDHKIYEENKKMEDFSKIKEEKIRDLCLVLNEMKVNDESKETKIKILKNELEKIKLTLIEKNEEIFKKGVEKNLHEVEIEKLKMNMQNLQSKTTEKNNNESLQKDQNETILIMKQEKVKIEDELAKSHLEINNLKHTLENKNEDFRKSLIQIDKLEKKIEKLEVELKKAQNEIESKKNEIKIKNNEIESQNKEIECKNNEIESKNNEIKTKNNEIESKNKEIEDKNNEIESQNKEIESKNKEIENKNNEIENKNNEILKKQAQFDETEKNLTKNLKEQEESNILLKKEIDEKIKAVINTEISHKNLINDLKIKEQGLKDAQIELVRMRKDNERVYDELKIALKNLKEKEDGTQGIKSKHNSRPKIEIIENNKSENNSEIQSYEEITKKIYLQVLGLETIVPKDVQALEASLGVILRTVSDLQRSKTNLSKTLNENAELKTLSQELQENIQNLTLKEEDYIGFLKQLDLSLDSFIKESDFVYISSTSKQEIIIKLEKKLNLFFKEKIESLMLKINDFEKNIKNLKLIGSFVCGDVFEKVLKFKPNLLFESNLKNESLAKMAFPFTIENMKKSTISKTYSENVLIAENNTNNRKCSLEVSKLTNKQSPKDSKVNTDLNKNEINKKTEENKSGININQKVHLNEKDHFKMRFKLMAVHFNKLNIRKMFHELGEITFAFQNHNLFKISESIEKENEILKEEIIQLTQKLIDFQNEKEESDQSENNSQILKNVNLNQIENNEKIKQLRELIAFLAEKLEINSIFDDFPIQFVEEVKKSIEDMFIVITMEENSMQNEKNQKVAKLDLKNVNNDSIFDENEAKMSLYSEVSEILEKKAEMSFCEEEKRKKHEFKENVQTQNFIQKNDKKPSIDKKLEHKLNNNIEIKHQFENEKSISDNLKKIIETLKKEIESLKKKTQDYESLVLTKEHIKSVFVQFLVQHLKGSKDSKFLIEILCNHLDLPKTEKANVILYVEALEPNKKLVAKLFEKKK